MKYRNKGNAIHDFFDDLFRAKGGICKAALDISPVQGEDPTSNRGVENFGSPVAHDPPERPSVKTFAVGTLFNLKLVSDISGYATLINFGSDGNCMRLVPWKNMAPLAVRAGQTVWIPDPELMRKYNQRAGFRLEGPNTRQTGLHEHFLVIVSPRVDVFEPWDLSRRFISGVNARAGFAGGVETGKSRLFSLPLTDWEFGLVSLTVSA